MNILLINHYAGSPEMGMEFRPYYMAREWEKMGHKVMIVTASQAHVRNLQFDINKPYKIREIEGIQYFIIKTPAYSGNSISRIKNMRAFVKGLNRFKNKFAETFQPDVVIASSTYPLDIYPAKKIANLSNAKLIFEVHDLWPLSPMELGGYSRLHPFVVIMQKAENYAYKHSDTVISMLPNAFEHMQKHGLKKEKFRHVPNGIVVEEWNKNREIPEVFTTTIDKEKEKGHKLLAYAGSHGVANALDSLLNAMAILKDQPVSLFLIGDGPLKSELIKFANSKNLSNVFFLPPVKKDIIPAILDKMDFLYIGLQNQSLFRFGISPNKLIDYLMAGKPIIQAIKAGNNIVGDANCGLAIEPENHDAIANAVCQLIILPKEKVEELGYNAHKYCLLHHDYKVLSKSFIEYISN
ncbi:MAG: glycosyltransferase family 4 protein [Bacteroidales bacterium]|nr:glycosyltransferase family 4 protein [Bacteroidales bacterium]